MNNLSWLIYFAQVTEGLQIAAVTLTAIASFVCLVTGMGWLCVENKKMEESAGYAFKRALPIGLILAVVAILTPDRQTMLLIAGSEIGERAAKTQTAQDIFNPGMDLLKSWIANETAKIKKESSK